MAHSSARVAPTTRWGWSLSVLTLIPYDFWRRDHAIHHATSGNLDRRGSGDVTTLTVREYLAQSRLRKMLYRLYRNPLVLLGLGPAYMLLVRYRIPSGESLRSWSDWISILGTNIAAAFGATAMVMTIGPVTFLVTWGAVMLLALSIGVWLFYVQHQFEDAYWENADQWNFHAAALGGSSFYDLPRVLHWLLRLDRIPPHSSSRQQDPELPPARLLRGNPGAAVCQPTDALGQRQIDRVDLVG